MWIGFMWLGCVLARVSCGHEVFTGQISMQSIATVVNEVQRVVAVELITLRR